MPPKLPLVGTQAVVQDFAGFNKAMDIVNKRIAESGKQSEDAAKKTDPLSRAFASVHKSLGGLQAQFDKVTANAGPAGQAIGSIVTQIGGIPAVAGLAVAGVAALVSSFIALGNRGAPLVGLGESFDKLTASVGIASQTLLTDLRAASLGTVADFDLIRQANVALAGATGEFGKQFGQNLPKLLEIARVQARATGQSVDYLYQSIITGIKRGSPLLIDNIGLVLKVGEANKTYAESVGKTVEQLTAEEKQIAILNATLEAGQGVLDVYGEQQETNAEKLARAQATITNTLDTLALAVQLAFGTVLDIINRILSGFQQLAVGLAPILSSIASVITDVLGGAFNIILDIIEPIFNAIASFLPYIAILFQGIANVVSGLVDGIRNIVGGIVNFLRGVAQNLFGLDVDNLGKSLFEGAARAFGAFANGILQVANRLIFPAIIGIAQFIADFLIGFSPPKEGPLSQIDKGGENLMAAWLQGITGVSLDPVKQVAAEVSTALGSIGKAGGRAIEKRLAQLDKALLPFQNRLDIVKSRFDAIAAPANAALDAIDRQMLAAEEALAGGDVAAAETIRRLDAQRAAIQANLDAQQQIVDNAQIQLSLAQAQQAQERTLLNIRKAQFVAVQKVAQKTDETRKEPKPAGGAAALPEAIAGGGFSLGTSDSSVLDLIGGQQAVNEAIAGIQEAFVGEIDTKGLMEFEINQGLLQNQLNRIGEVDLGAKLSEKFGGITDLFNPSVEGSPANVISNFFSPDAATSGSLASFVNSIPSTIDGLTGGIKTSVDNFFNGLFNPDAAGSPVQTIQNLFAGADTDGSIANLFSNLGPNLEAAAPTIKSAVDGAVRSIFDPDQEGSPANFIVTKVQELTGDENTANSVAWFFKDLPANVNTALSTLGDQVSAAFESVKTFLTGEGEGTLSGVLNSVVTFFADLPGRIVTALQGIGATLYNAVVVPVINVFNALIGVVEGAIKGVIDGVAAPFKSIVDTFGDATPGPIKDIATSLANASAGINFGRISTDLPDFLKPQEAARGGIFSKGLLSVGERGQEYLYNASKVGVLPNQLAQAIDGLQSILAQPAPMMIPGNSYDSHNSSSTFNFNGVQSDQDARRRYNAMRAGMR